MKKPKKSWQEKQEERQRRFIFAHQATEEQFASLLVLRKQHVSNGTLLIVETGAIPVRQVLKAFGFGWDAKRQEWRRLVMNPKQFLEALQFALPEGWEVRTYDAAPERRAA